MTLATVSMGRNRRSGETSSNRVTFSHVTAGARNEEEKFTTRHKKENHSVATQHLAQSREDSIFLLTAACCDWEVLHGSSIS